MSDKFGILLIGNFVSRTIGFRSFGEDLAAELSAAGWSVFTASEESRRIPRLFDMLLTAWRHRRDYAAAYVEVYSGPAFFWAELVCYLLRRLHKPYVLTLHGGNLPVFARQWPKRVKRLLDSAAVVTAPSPYLHEQMRPYRSDLFLLPSAFDLKAYDFKQRNKPSAKLVWLRSFHAVYNPALAPRVLALLTSEFPDIRLMMIGPDKGDGSAQEMRQVADALKVLELISQPGSVAKPDVPRRLNEGDIFLNTTNVDNTPMSVIEAMACGLCVVSTNVGGIPYLLEHEHDALLVPPNDELAMAAAVRRILTEPELAERLSSNARRKVEQRDWSRSLPCWEELFTSITKKN